MKLIAIKCPSCGAPIKLDKTEGTVQCPYCNASFYIDKEEKGPDTVNINIHNYARENKKVNSVVSPLILKIAVILFWVLFINFMFFQRTPATQKAEKAEKHSTYIEVPKSEPFRDFVYELYGKGADNITKDDYAKLSYLMVDKAENDDEADWIFSYSYKVDSDGLPIDEQKIMVDGTASLQVRDFQAFTGLISAGYGANGDYNWDGEEPHEKNRKIDFKNLTDLKFFVSEGQHFGEIKNYFAEPANISGLSLASLGNITTQDLETFSNLKHLRLNGRWAENGEQEYWQLLSSLKSLEELDLAFNFDEFSLNFLSSLTNLKKLKITNSDSDNKVSGLEVLYAMPKIEVLKIDGVKQLKVLDFVKNMPLLHNLTIEDCNIADIEPLRDNLAITDFHIYADSDSLKNLSALPTLKSLTKLYVAANGIDKGQMPNLSSLTNLKELTIDAIHTQAIKNMSWLEKLELTYWATFDAQDLARLTGLKELVIKDMVVRGNIFNIIASLPQLTKLEITENDSRDYLDISPLFSSNSIEDLKFSYSYGDDDGRAYVSLSSMPDNTKIKKFEMSSYSIINLDTGDYNSKPLGNFSNEFLSHLKGVEELKISGNQINDLNFVTAMPNLTMLDISDNYVKDIGVLTSCKKLKKLICKDNPIVNYSVMSENVEVIK